MRFSTSASYGPRILACFLLLACFPVISQGGVTISRHIYTVDDGLPSNSVYDIVQDESGFVWFGTGNGLSRFDGQSFRNYRKNDGSGLSNNNILHLEVDRRGHIWITLDTGVDIYMPEKDRFVHFDKRTADGKGISGRAIDVLEDREGDIWITTVNEGLFRYSPEKDILQVYCHDPEDIGSISQDYISTVYESHDGVIWLGTYNSGLCAMDRNTGVCRRYSRDKDGLSGNSIDAIMEDSYGNLWIGTVNNGLDCLDRTAGKIKNMGCNEMLYRIHRLAEPSLGKLIVSSERGAFMFNIMDGEITPCQQNESLYTGTSLSCIYSFLKDREGNLWFGSFDGGVEFYPSSTDFTCYETICDYDSKAGKVVSAICEHGDGRYWVGTSNNGIMLLDTKEETVVPYFVPSFQVLSLMLDGNILWAAVYERGICSIDLQGGRTRNYMNGQNDARVFSLLRSSNSRIYAGAADGLYMYDNVADSFARLRESSRVTDIEEDKNGLIWVSTAENGIYSYNPRSGEYLEYVHGEGNSILSNSVNTIVVDMANRLWIGTNDGICSYDGHEFISWPDIRFPDDNISQIIPDGRRLWVSTGNGLVEFYPETGHMKVYSRTDGLISQQFSKNAGIYGSAGNILLGTVDGIVMFSPDKITDAVSIPPVVITELLINGNSVYPYMADSPVDRPIERMQELVLSHRQSFIGLRFASPSYRGAGNIRYRFRLDRNHDKDSWHLQEEHSPVYYNLSPGKYIFRVQAASGNGGWNNGETALTIYVKSHPLKSTVAYMVYGILVLIAAAFAGLLVFRRSREKYRMRLQQLKGRQEQELYEMKINFFTNVAHEIRTPLSLISGPLEYIMKDTEVRGRYDEYFRVIDKNNRRLCELVNQLLDFNKASSGGNHVPRYGNCRLSALLDHILDMFSFKARSRGISIIRDYPADMSMVIDPEAVTKIVNNLVGNAVKFAEKEIRITAGLDEAGLSITVTDDGPGVPEEYREKIFGLFYQVNDRNIGRREGIGIGLHLVRTLTSMMGGEVHAEGRTDIDEAGNICHGAVISLSIPYTDRLPGDVECMAVEAETSGADAEEDNPGCDESGMKRILLVDDSVEMTAFLQKIFSGTYCTSVAYNGEDALEMLQEADFDMVVSDVMMPGMSGIELCRKIKEDIRTSHVHVILLTAKIDNESKIESLQYGVDAYVEKPFSPQHLLAQVGNLMKKNMDDMKNYSKTPLVEIRQITRNQIDKEFMEKCSSVIIANMGNAEMSVDILARELALSRTAIFRKLKAITGMTPNDFMKFVRLNEACRLLAEGRYSITEIGYITGFSSSSYFAKCFFRQFGILPSDFVKSITGETQKDDIDI